MDNYFVISCPDGQGSLTYYFSKDGNFYYDIKKARKYKTLKTACRAFNKYVDDEECVIEEHDKDNKYIRTIELELQFYLC